MSVIKIVGNPVGFNCRVFVDGNEIVGVRSIEVSKIEPDKLVTAKLELFLDEGSEIELPSEVSAEIVPLTQTGKVEVSQIGDSHRRYKLVEP